VFLALIRPREMVIALLKLKWGVGGAFAASRHLPGCMLTGGRRHPKLACVNRQCHGSLDERQLEMPVEAAEETAIPKTAASWRKPKNKSSAQKQKMP